MKTLLLILLLQPFSSAIAETKPAALANELKQDICLSAREYITTLNFLRSKKEYQLSEKEMQKIADQVSQGCSGSSQRFIKVHKLLSKMGIETRSSIQNSLKFIDKDDNFTKVFIEIFRITYDPKYLDLDVFQAMKISLRLSADYTGDVEKSLNDFKYIVSFCSKHTSMELASAQCANLASDITAIGQDYKDSIAEPFKELVLFMQDDKSGPHLDRNNSLKVAKKVISHGPLAVKNFKQAFKFATHKNGLNIPTNRAVSFATKIAGRSVKKDNSLQTKELKSVKK